ncbi:MAG TPA: Gfo/Idh/MocA family oxidoreductase [Planctomycetaceae bacterium]|nr:Gfo/Idh/MocA family oxidoreductase [Planctomycetaceae bacterium]
MKRLKMAVIGVGALGRHHARILAGLDAVELVAVVDSDARRAQSIADQHNVEWQTDHRTVLDRVDAVSIVVPTCAHLEVASEFLARRIPTLVEKPLAGDAQQAEKLVALAEQTGTLLQVGHVERFNPASQVMRECCGTPRYIRAERLSPYTFRSTDIGVVHDMMVHDLDLILDLVGSDVRRIEAFGISVMGEHEDAVQARIVFQNGCVADLTASRVNPTVRRTFQVWSLQGCLHADLQARHVTRFAPSGTLRVGPSPLTLARAGADLQQLKQDVFGRFIEIEELAVSDQDALTAELLSFVDCVRTGQRPLVGGPEALRVLQLADRIVEDVGGHCWDAAGQFVGPFLFAAPRETKRAA